MRSFPDQDLLENISWIFLDVDGVMTDGGIILGADDLELKRFHSRDGHALALARRAGFKVGFFTGRHSRAVARRAKELHLDACHQGRSDKAQAFEDICREHAITPLQAAYIGDDLQDAPVLSQVTLAATPADGVSELDKICHLRTEKAGGHGAVREFIEILLKKRNLWSQTLERFGL
jgi:3-deoxy-D-manno-octulosonate 8-phosphate phosphatase (KDO 8-P phosphatase)